MSFPPPGSDFEEEEEEHEEEAGADVQDHTQTHVHAVKTQTQNPNTSSPASSPQAQNLPSPQRGLLLSFPNWLLPLSSFFFSSFSSSFSSVLLLRPTGLCRIRIRRRSGEAWGSQGVFGGQVGGPVVLSEEEEDIVVVPDVDTIFLLVAGGAEGGARPRSFREEGVITQRAWRRRREKLFSTCQIVIT